MKRLLYFLLAFTVAFAILGSTVAFAEEVVESADVPSTESDDVNFFTRLYEAFTENKTDIFTLGGSAVLFVISMILKKDLGATSRNVVDNIARVLSKTDLTVEQQKSIADGLNEMVDGYDEIKETSKNVADKLDEFAEQMQTVLNSNADLERKLNDSFNLLATLIEKGMLQNADLMEAVSSIYTNSKLPSGIKDYVALKRTDSVKLVKEAAELLHHDEGGAVNE
jgi:methyl-accepting chemotaxis protein